MSYPTDKVREQLKELWFLLAEALHAALSNKEKRPRASLLDVARKFVADNHQLLALHRELLTIAPVAKSIEDKLKAFGIELPVFDDGAMGEQARESDSIRPKASNTKPPALRLMIAFDKKKLH